MIPIILDNTTEIEECFNFTISTNSTLFGLTLDPTSATIFISDPDKGWHLHWHIIIMFVKSLVIILKFRVAHAFYVVYSHYELILLHHYKYVAAQNKGERFHTTQYAYIGLWLLILGTQCIKDTEVDLCVYAQNHLLNVCMSIEKQYDMAGSSDQTFVVFSENAQYSSYGACGIVWLWPLDIIISMLSFEGNNAKMQQGSHCVV